jgi:hypothetical protein
LEPSLPIGYSTKHVERRAYISLSGGAILSDFNKVRPKTKPEQILLLR